MSEIHDLAKRGDLDGVRSWLHDHPEDVNARDKYGETPLHLASCYGHTESVKLLLAMPGVDVNARDLYGRTPLHLASRKSHAEVVKLLIKWGGVCSKSSTFTLS